MALTLNSEFTSSVIINKNLTVNDSAHFNDSVVIGNGYVTEGSKSVSMGDYCSSTDNYAISIGLSSEANGNTSIAAGLKCRAQKENSFVFGQYADSYYKNSFVWSGISGEHQALYTSQGEGSFCINPETTGGGAEAHVYIGNKTLSSIIQDISCSTVRNSGLTYTAENTYTASTSFDGNVTVQNNSRFILSNGVNASFNGNNSFNGAIYVPNVDTSNIDTYRNSKRAANTKFVADVIEKTPFITSTLTGNTGTVEFTGTTHHYGNFSIKPLKNYGRLYLAYDNPLTNDTSLKEAVNRGYVDRAVRNSRLTVESHGNKLEGKKIATLHINESINSIVSEVSSAEIYCPNIVGGDNINVKYDNSTQTFYLSGTKPDYVIEGGSIRVPVGCILPMCCNEAPEGFLLCDGSEYPKDGEYIELYNIIGDKFNNQSTEVTKANYFRVPKLDTGEFLQGSTLYGEMVDPALPDITAETVFSENPSVYGKIFSLPTAESTVSGFSISTTNKPSKIDITATTTRAGNHSHDITVDRWNAGVTNGSSTSMSVHGRTKGGTNSEGGVIRICENGLHSHIVNIQGEITPEVDTKLTVGSVKTTLKGGSIDCGISSVGKLKTTLNKSDIYNSSCTTVQPKAMKMRFYIKAKTISSDSNGVLKINNTLPEADGNFTINASTLKVLPIEGGTVDGYLTVNETLSASKDIVANSAIYANGGITQSDDYRTLNLKSGNGASVELNGTYVDNGSFSISVKDSNRVSKSLTASTSDNLKWDNKYVVTRVNGQYADSTGNVEIPEEIWVFTLANGTTVSSYVCTQQIVAQNESTDD